MFLNAEGKALCCGPSKACRPPLEAQPPGARPAQLVLTTKHEALCWNTQTYEPCRPPPEAHRPALDLRGRGDLDELVEATGRPYRTYNYYAPTESPPFDVSEPPPLSSGSPPFAVRKAKHYLLQQWPPCSDSPASAWQQLH
jgi:hypothetical protein